MPRPKNEVIVIDRTKARVFSTDPFELIETVPNPLGRERNRAMRLDKPGISRGKLVKPSSTHSLTGERSPHDEAAHDFAREIARRIEAEFREQRLRRIMIVAEARMTGMLRDSLKPRIQKLIRWLQKDWGKLNEHEVGLKLGVDFRVTDRRPRVPPTAIESL